VIIGAAALDSVQVDARVKIEEECGVWSVKVDTSDGAIFWHGTFQSGALRHIECSFYEHNSRIIRM